MIYGKKWLAIKVPDDMSFSDLELNRESDGMISFRWDAVERICAENDLSIEFFKHGPEDCVAGIIVGWYLHHRKSGGAVDLTAERLVQETMEEMRRERDALNN